MFGCTAGCGGSQPADTRQPAETQTEPGAPTVQEGTQNVPGLGASAITGTVTFPGEAPSLAPLAMDAEPVCHKAHGGKPVPDEMLVLGQPYRILNSDGILHNIHTLPKINPAFNRGQPATVKEMTTSFPKPEAMLEIKCDVHPWMSASGTRGWGLRRPRSRLAPARR